MRSMSMVGRQCRSPGLLGVYSSCRHRICFCLLDFFSPAFLSCCFFGCRFLLLFSLLFVSKYSQHSGEHTERFMGGRQNQYTVIKKRCTHFESILFINFVASSWSHMHTRYSDRIVRPSEYDSMHCALPWQSREEFYSTHRHQTLKSIWMRTNAARACTMAKKVNCIVLDAWRVKCTAW